MPQQRSVTFAAGLTSAVGIVYVDGMRTKLILLVFLAVLASSCSSSGTDETVSSTSSPATTTIEVATSATATSAPQTSIAPPTTEGIDTAALRTVGEVLAADRVLTLAHAGGDQAYPHSTMFAYRNAVADGADVLELDVQLTADDVLVVQHDDTVDKTTEATGPVIELTLEELQALDNAYWFSPQCWPCQDRPTAEYVYRGMRTGEVEPPEGFSADDFRVATLREVSETFPDHVLDIEIKGNEESGPATARALAAELADLGREDSAVVVSFSDAIVDVFHEAAPDVAVSPGTDRLTDWFLNGTELEPYFSVVQIPPFSSGIAVATPETIARAHDEGLTVWVWPDDAGTQENTDFYLELISYGVDGVIAGRPAEMTAAIDQAPPFVAAARSTGCGGPAPEAGHNVATVTSGGIDRTYQLFIPSSYDPQQPLPVVLNFHGYTGDGPLQALSSGMDILAEEEGFISVAPDGLGTVSYWNLATDNDLPNDVMFVSDLLDQMEADLCVDTNRVFSTGLSNGGFLTSRLACDLSDRIAAVATVAATMFYDDCEPGRPVPLLAIHGTDDQIVPFTGVRDNTSQLEATGLTTSVADPGVDEMFAATIGAAIGADDPTADIATEVEEWSNNNACRPGGETETIAEDVERVEYIGCDAPTQLYVVLDGGHSWPGSSLLAGVEGLGFTTDSIDATQLAWSFFESNPLR